MGPSSHGSRSLPVCEAGSRATANRQQHATAKHHHATRLKIAPLIRQCSAWRLPHTQDMYVAKPIMPLASKSLSSSGSAVAAACSSADGEAAGAAAGDGVAASASSCSSCRGRAWVQTGPVERAKQQGGVEQRLHLHHTALISTRQTSFPCAPPTHLKVRFVRQGCLCSPVFRRCLPARRCASRSSLPCPRKHARRRWRQWLWRCHYTGGGASH